MILVGVAVVTLAVRSLVVPEDFVVGERGYMYGWHRKANVEEWRALKTKYRGAEFCAKCHEEESEDLAGSPHASINCENCHGPSLLHPKEPEVLPIDRSPQLCLRCHYKLPYPTSGRAKIRGIDPETHYAGRGGCVKCHQSHLPQERKPE